MSKMPERFYINITPMDICGGAPQSCGRCPTALAVRREYKNQIPLVLYSKTYINGACYQHSKPLCDWIRAYDTGKKVEPGKFLLTQTDMPKNFLKGQCK